jgi:hypothetical protein
MQFDQKRPELEYRGGVKPRAKELLVKVAAVTGGAVMLLSALALSIVFFAGLLMVVLVGGGYLWWKTRELRKQLRTQSAHDDVIEGVVVREVLESGERKRK